MRKCSIVGCDREIRAKGFCNSHYQKYKRYGDPNKCREPAKGWIDESGYRRIKIKDRYVREHRMVVESVLGFELPIGPVIHHWNEIKSDNRKENLLVCHDEAYHQLIHLRMRAYDACGDANARQCFYCKEWSPLSMIDINKSNSSAQHRDCRNEYKRNLSLKKKLQNLTKREQNDERDN